MGWDNWTPYNDWGPVWVKYLDPAPSVGINPAVSALGPGHPNTLACQENYTNFLNEMNG
jgi:hypothetical protein